MKKERERDDDCSERDEAEIETDKKWRQWRQRSVQRDIAVICEMEDGGKCVRVKQMDSRMIPS